MNKTRISKIYLFVFLMTIGGLNTSFISEAPNNNQNGIFSFTLNNKPYIIEGITAKYRTVTGGYKQLSLSNDLFTSFFFNNPTAKIFEFTSQRNKEAIVKYTNPSNLITFCPEKGKINITVLDNQAHLVSGEFELEMYQQDQPTKKIKITNGKFINVPILEK